jgi:Family of unknown function (DUF5636)
MSYVTSEQAALNLKEIFDEDISKQDHFAEWCDLGSFLTDKDKVLKAMAELDTHMFEKICAKKSLNTKHVPNRQMVTRAYSYYYYGLTTEIPLPVLLKKADVTHLLSDLLTENEEKFHFTTETGESQQTTTLATPRTTAVDTRKHVPTYHGFVQPENFIKQLKKKAQWKDPGAQPVHGEYTHRLQWYALTSGLWSSGPTASDVFESIGNYSGAYDRGEGAIPPKLYLWDALCDRTNGQDVSFNDALFLTSDYDKGRGDDFRSPENLNWFLITNDGFKEHRWPLLQTFLIARYNKRVPQFEASAQYNENDPMFYFQATYLSKKLYQQTYEDVAKVSEKKSVIEHLIYKSDQIWKF